MLTSDNDIVRMRILVLASAAVPGFFGLTLLLSSLTGGFIFSSVPGPGGLTTSSSF